MIVVLSLNTAVDRTLIVPRFTPGRVFRTRDVTITAGGKGLNVAHAVRRLGAEVTVVGFLGGAPVPFVTAGCAAAGIEQRWVQIGEETRTCVIVVDSVTGAQTVVNESGPTVTAGEVARLRAAVLDTVGHGDLVCISGSAPPGVPADLYATLVNALQRRGARVLVDSSGPPLTLALEARPWAVAPNEEEAAAALGMAASPAELAARLASQASHVLLTLGAAGVVHASRTSVTRYRPPRVPVGNAVASGDAFAAGFLVGIERGWSVQRAVRLAVACGASNAGRAGPGIGETEEIERLMAETVVPAMETHPG